MRNTKQTRTRRRCATHTNVVTYSRLHACVCVTGVHAVEQVQRCATGHTGLVASHPRRREPEKIILGARVEMIFSWSQATKGNNNRQATKEPNKYQACATWFSYECVRAPVFPFVCRIVNGNVIIGRPLLYWGAGLFFFEMVNGEGPQRHQLILPLTSSPGKILQEIVSTYSKRDHRERKNRMRVGCRKTHTSAL